MLTGMRRLPAIGVNASQLLNRGFKNERAPVRPKYYSYGAQRRINYRAIQVAWLRVGLLCPTTGAVLIMPLPWLFISLCSWVKLLTLQPLTQTYLTLHTAAVGPSFYSFMAYRNPWGGIQANAWLRGGLALLLVCNSTAAQLARVTGYLPLLFFVGGYRSHYVNFFT